MKEYIVAVPEHLAGDLFKGDPLLIRCKDCKHWACDDSDSYCDELGIFGTDMNSYCSYAERKEE